MKEEACCSSQKGQDLHDRSGAVPGSLPAGRAQALLMKRDRGGIFPGSSRLCRRVWKWGRKEGWLQSESTRQGKAGTGHGGKHHGLGIPVVPVLGQTRPFLHRAISITLVAPG